MLSFREIKKHDNDGKHRDPVAKQIQMQEKLREAIQHSQALDKESKKVYLALISFLPIEKVEQLLKIFQKEIILFARIKGKTKEQKKELYREHIKNIETTFKTWLGVTIAKEEKKEKSSAENILRELDNIKQ